MCLVYTGLGTYLCFLEVCVGMVKCSGEMAWGLKGEARYIVCNTDQFQLCSIFAWALWTITETRRWWEVLGSHPWTLPTFFYSKVPHNPCILLLVRWGDERTGIIVRNALGDAFAMCTRQSKLRRWWLELQQKWVRGLPGLHWILKLIAGTSSVASTDEIMTSHLLAQSSGISVFFNNQAIMQALVPT